MADIKSINGNPIVPESVADGAVGVDGLAEDVVELLDNKADIDGYYSQLTAGLAENLIGRGDAVPAEYLYRTAGGTADIEDGIATVSCIKGNTLVWNQYVNIPNGSATNMGVTFTYNADDGTITATGTATDKYAINTRAFNALAGHKYLIRGGAKGSSTSTYRSYLTASTVTLETTVYDNGEGAIANAVGNGLMTYVLAYICQGVTVDGVVFRPQLFDLTLMFGVGNEPTTVAEFDAMFPLPYYPYSAPKLLPVDMRGIETVGFNLLEDARRFNTTKNNYANNLFGSNIDELNAFKDNLRKLKSLGQDLYWHIVADKLSTSGGLPVGTITLYGETTSVKLMQITRDTVFNLSDLDIDRVGYVVLYGPSPSTDVTFSEACINLSWSGYRNGEYEEYWSAERPIDTSRFFPTGMKKAGDKADALYADHYDTVIGSVDLGTQDWVYEETNLRFRAKIADRVGENGKVGLPNLAVSANYAPTSSYAFDHNQTVDKTIRGSGNADGWVFIRDLSYNTAADFKAAMSGVILYYELTTPTTTEIDPPLNLSYKVSDFGTERIMVDETVDAPKSAPVPMEVEYGINAIDTIRRLPKEYQSHKSMGQLAAALESSLGIDITETWDENDQRYEYEVSNLEVGTDEIADGSVTTAKLADGTVTAGKLASNAVSTTTVQDGSITGVKIADDTIPDAKLAQTGGIYSAVYDVQPIALPQEYAQPQTLKVALSEGGKLWYGTHNVAELLGIKEGTFEINGVTFTVSGMTISISGTATADFNYSLVDGAAKTSTELMAMTLPLPNGQLFTFSAKALNTATVHPAFMSRGKVSGNAFTCQNNTTQFTMDTSTCGGLYCYIQSGRTYDVSYNLALMPFAASNTSPWRDETSSVTEIDESGTHEVSGYVWGSGATVALVASRIEQATRKCRAIYSQQAIPYTGSTEVLDVFIPCKGGYVHVLLGHTVNQESNADSWRIIQFKAANDQMADLFNITQFGETEMAIKINGRSDFIGGYTHGDEVMVSGSLAFVMDGAPIDVSTLTDYTEFDNLKIVEVTNLYDPNDSTTIVGKHGREYVITKDGIDLLQTVIWDGSYTLDGSYMPMVCAIRGNDSTSATQITDTYFDDGNFELYDVSSPNFGGYPKSNKADVRRMVLYSDVSNVCITTDIVSQTELTGRASFLYDGDAYNKIYNGVCGVTAQHTTQAGDKWQTRAHLKFEIG